MNVTTTVYDAEFGRAGGAITNVTLKSGTNALKGSVFAFGNNEKTTANGYFSHTDPPTDYLQTGFTLGGPIEQNRVFYFGDYQHTTDHAGRTDHRIEHRSRSSSESSSYVTLTHNGTHARSGASCAATRRSPWWGCRPNGTARATSPPSTCRSTATASSR